MTAYADELVPSNPCRIRGAGKAKRQSLTKPATLAELEVILEATPERVRMMVLPAAWCGFASESWPSCAAGTSTSRRASSMSVEL